MIARRNPFRRERWYERTGGISAEDRSAVVMLTVARYEEPPVAVDFHEHGGAGLDGIGLDRADLVVTLGSEHPAQLEEFIEDLEALAVRSTWWSPIRESSQAMERLRQPVRAERARERFVAAVASIDAGAHPGESLEDLTARLGRTAAEVSPPTEASQRTRAALAEVHQRLSGKPTPF